MEAPPSTIAVPSDAAHADEVPVTEEQVRCGRDLLTAGMSSTRMRLSLCQKAGSPCSKHYEHHHSTCRQLALHSSCSRSPL